MRLPKLQDLNNEVFLNDAFNADHHESLLKAARIRRNIYLWFSLTGFACIFITVFTGEFLMSILSLFLATLSLVVMTKYDTQLFFLRIIRMRELQRQGER